jgi:hypothetical protein
MMWSILRWSFSDARPQERREMTSSGNYGVTSMRYENVDFPFQMQACPLILGIPKPIRCLAFKDSSRTCGKV